MWTLKQVWDNFLSFVFKSFDKYFDKYFDKSCDKFDKFDATLKKSLGAR